MRTRDKRYAGDWIPKDGRAKRKGRCRRRFVAPKSEMQIISEKNRRNSL